MVQGKRSRRIVAATLLTILLTDTFAPGICYALTSGPTQPEATSFEPVDTTDMVNMQTGDFTYNIPLLEVPGPEGGYPLALSYHAGVHTNDDASWVGLGWSLNPGAVNRTVNGLPDDWKGLSMGSQTYWAGDQTSVYGVGLTIGDANGPDNVTFGLQVASDTYKGLSFGMSVSAMGVNFGKGLYDKTPSLSVGVPVDGFQMGGARASMGLTLKTNFSSLTVGVNGSVGFTGGSAEGSMSSDGKGSSGANPALGGISEPFAHSSKSNLLQTSTWGLSNLRIPLYPGFSLDLSFSKKRTWINSSTSLTGDGVYAQQWSLPGQNVVYDNYALLDDPATYNIMLYPDPTIMEGGGFPDFDDYSVTAQGLGGNMRPYEFQGELMGQERLDGNNRVSAQYITGTDAAYPAGFRFVGDFSNSFRQKSTSYTDPSAPYTNTTTVPFDASPLYGSNSATSGLGSGTSTGNYGANLSGGRAGNPSLAGSRHIDLGVKVNPSNCPTSSPGRYAEGMFSGFAITNESGVTYNYGLAAYSYGEENYQEKIDRSNGLYFNRNIKPKGSAYAYTWYLTTITGADYVDRNNNQIADAGDWGYWVNFEYGEWSDGYVWRNPANNFNKDEDNRYRDCSMGYREVYYLNAIRTASHVALFEKDVRNDGKSESPVIFAKNGGEPEPGLFRYDRDL